MLNVKRDYLNERANLSSIVVDYIKDSILRGDLIGGDRIIEQDVSSKLDISRAPVREAIRELEKEGIVTSKPRRGVVVSESSLEDIKEVFDIRLLLEDDINKILIKENKLNSEDFKNLEKLIEEMVEIANADISYKDKLLLINHKDMEFHRYIWMKSGSKRRVKILESLFFQLRIAMLYDTNQTGNFMKTATDHYNIIAALKSKNIEECGNALRNHIISYYNKVF